MIISLLCFPVGPHMQPISIYKEKEPLYYDSLDTYI